MKQLKMILLASIVVFFTACGGGGSSSTDSYVEAISPTFSALDAVDENGNSTALYWKYKINNGQPVTTTVSGLTMQLNPTDTMVTVDANRQQKTYVVSGNISGYDYYYDISFNGNFSMTSIEYIIQDAGKVLITGGKAEMDMTLTAEGETVNLAFVSDVVFNNPFELFPENSQLDTFEIGYSQYETASATVTGTINITGLPTDQYTTNTSLPVSWEIIDKLDSIVVQGKTYHNIIVVEETKEIPDIQNLGNLQEATTIAWIAKGIGVVKSYGPLDVFQSPVYMELVETNLEQ